MAQLTNENKSIDSWLESQYSDNTEVMSPALLEEEISLTPLSQFSQPYVSMKDSATETESSHVNVEREIGRVFGILGHHINRLNRAKSAKRPASKKYAEMKKIIAELSRDAEAAGIKLELNYPDEVIEDETIIEEPKED